MKKLLFIILFVSVNIFAQNDDFDKNLDTLYLKDGNTLKGVIKKDRNSTYKLKMCKGNSRSKTGKCVKYKSSQVDSFAYFYHHLKKAGGPMGFGKKEFESGYKNYFTLKYSNNNLSFGSISLKGQNFDFYRSSYVDYQTLKNFILVTKPGSKNIIAWFKTGNTNENIRNAKKAFPKCEKELQKFKKSKNKKEISIMEIIDKKCV